MFATEDHSYFATRLEKNRNENSWKVVLNSEGANGPVNQRDDCKKAKKTCDRQYKECATAAGMSTQEFILEIKFDKDRNNNSKDMKMIFIVLIQKQDGNIISLQPPRVLLHHLGGNHPTAGGQHGIGTLHRGMSYSFFSFQM